MENVSIRGVLSRIRSMSWYTPGAMLPDLPSWQTLSCMQENAILPQIYFHGDSRAWVTRKPFAMDIMWLALCTTVRQLCGIIGSSCGEEGFLKTDRSDGAGMHTHTCAAASAHLHMYRSMQNYLQGGQWQEEIDSTGRWNLTQSMR
jgi:hypothetical protein